MTDNRTEGRPKAAPDEVDVAVVGAGLSGLVAGHRLVVAGASVCVLEARARVGGRTLSVPLGAGVADLGGLWISPTQTHVRDLAEELGATMVPQARAGAAVVADEPGPGRLMRLAGHLELAWRLRTIERLSARVAAVGVEAVPERWRAASMGDWLTQVRSRAARAQLDLLVRLHFAAEPGELSLPFALRGLAASGGLTGSAAAAGPELCIVGGAQTLAQTLAASLGERVLVNRPVRRIDQSAQRAGQSAQRAGAVSLLADAGAGRGCCEVRARFAILAVPPPLTAQIEIFPPLPEACRDLHRSMRMAPVIKHAFAYERGFWHERGLSGEAYDLGGPVSAVVDHSAVAGVPALLAFVVGDAARLMSDLDPSSQRDIVAGALAELLGPEAGAPSAHASHDWLRDPWSAGCVGVLPPSPPARHAHAPVAPVGRLHFAGSERARLWPSYMDGAVEAGERAAGEVLARLSGGDNRS
ncbi:flavin monoamine oxidase family protein [Haliangium sp.]|uniref:flavin monoamine oxidase family protein n=1 Tax=Haliangium sp. TaxID=2663208 RepID=UPI003D0E6AEE